MKKIFTLIAAALMAVSANAEAPYTLANFGAGVESTIYDATTHTLTFTNAWSTCVGWWDTVDLSAYNDITIEFESATTADIQMDVAYTGLGTNEKKYVSAGVTSITYTLNADYKSAVEHIYLQAATAGASVVLKSVTFTDAYETKDIVLADFETDETSNAAASWGGTGSIVEVDGGHVYQVAEASYPPIMVDLSNVSTENLRNTVAVKFRVTATANTGGDGNLSWNQMKVGLTDDKYTETASDYQVDATIWKSGDPELNIWTSVEATVSNEFTSYLDADKTASYLMVKYGKNASSFQIDDITLVVKDTSSNTDGIKTISVVNAVENNVYYNLSGQKVEKPSKGIYIHNGKKVVVK